VVDCVVDGREDPDVEGLPSFHRNGDRGLNPLSVCGCSGVGVATILRLKGLAGAAVWLSIKPCAEEGLGITSERGRVGDSPRIFE